MGLLGAENLRTIFTKTDHWLYIFIYYGGYQLELLSSNGYPKITAILRQGRVVNHKAVQRIMQKYGWPCRVKV
ncbi:IS3 family transposase [Lysinibacillus sphaericus]|uniref:IS3 family transposase n=1 Tax=Lysinibacillus sphaericus TaxID=1421 RepID=UPI000777315F|nr:IS3 family transposase [Lysinibacillus sphaericus]AMO31027.1 hypothetical protein AR327_00010 [Lysinibacillus sphaericus]